MTKSRLRVAYLHMTTFHGGATKSLLLALEALGDRVEKRVVLSEAQPGELADRFVRAALSFETVPVPLFSHSRLGGSRTRWERLRASWGARGPCRELAAKLRAWGTQVLHVNSTVYAPALLRLREALPDVRIVTHAREEVLRGDPMSDWVIDALWRSSDAIIAISENEAAAFRGHPGLSVVLNPMPLPSLDEGKGREFREAHGLPPDTLLCGMLGQFSRTKGQLDFLRAIGALFARGFDRRRARFVIIGWKTFPRWREALKRLVRPEAYTLQIERCIRDQDLERSLIIVPSAPRVDEALSALDVVVRPSTLGDPWGRDVIEAMSWAKPMVATGSSEVFVEEGRTGFLVPPAAPEPMAERIARLLDDAGLRRTMGERARDRIGTLCDPASHAERLLAVYERLQVPARSV